jgi:hypothetical protein
MQGEVDRLQELLKKNASCGSDLTPEEYAEALRLIAGAIPSDQICWVCKMLEQPEEDEGNRAIIGSNLCRGHIAYALITRK